MSSIFIHSHALCESNQIGSGTRIWAFVHIMPGVAIGSDCNICDHVYIESGVTIGNRVTIKSGVQLWETTVIEDDVFIGPNVTFTNDKWPKSRVPSLVHQHLLIRQGASIGANATILPGLELGKNCMIGAGAVVTKSVPENALVIGNPAKVVRELD
jgi:UDP-2-acetamido-3-amino-2,3-dideoxy-glucuronate N-acetyltransferase